MIVRVNLTLLKKKVCLRTLLKNKIYLKEDSLKKIQVFYHLQDK